MNGRPLPAPGHMGVDYEERVDFDRLRRYRIGRAREALEGSECGAFLLFDFYNIRYTTQTWIGGALGDKMTRYALLTRESPEPWLSVYSATKAAVVAYTEAMNKELSADGVKSVALCPGFVDTDMSDFVKDRIPAEKMLKTSDVAEALRFLLRVSPTCLIPEIIFRRTGETI